MIDLVSFIRWGGYIGLVAVVFAESGLLIGFFLPGDSLLFTAGFLASQGVFHIQFLAPLLWLAAVLGDSVGYSFGYKIGPRIFTRENSIFFNKDHLIRAEQFYQKHGKKTIILARFLPVIRTFAPIVAGVGRMQYSTFLAYNIIGGGIWAAGMTLLGYFLGNSIPNIDHYLLPIIAGIIIVSFLPTIIHFVRHKDDRQHLILTIKKMSVNIFKKS